MNDAAPPLSLETLIGFNAQLGFRLVEWRQDFARMELELEPRHLNRSGFVHGGVLATLIDATGGFCGVYTPEQGRKRRCVTLTMTTSYLGQTKSGIINCSARRRGGGRTVFMMTAEVHAEDGTLLAIGEGTYRYIAETPR
jgi:uncharacterized protein (TIGR00369 family)